MAGLAEAGGGVLLALGAATCIGLAGGGIQLARRRRSTAQPQAQAQSA